MARSWRPDDDGQDLAPIEGASYDAAHLHLPWPGREALRVICDWRGRTLHLAPVGELDLASLPALERTLAARAAERPAGSYTVELLEDPPRIGEKVMEEAEEVARAAREESDARVDEEAADVLYHLLVLLHSRRRRLADAERVLDARRR